MEDKRKEFIDTIKKRVQTTKDKAMAEGRVLPKPNPDMIKKMRMRAQEVAKGDVEITSKEVTNENIKKFLKKIKEHKNKKDLSNE